MASLTERFKSKRFRLGVKQHALVLEFTTAIQDAMNAFAITQSDLAKRLGKSRSWVSKIFRRTPNLTFFTAVEVANALDMDIEILVAPRVEVGAGTGLLVNPFVPALNMSDVTVSPEVRAGVVLANAGPVPANDPQALAA